MAKGSLHPRSGEQSCSIPGGTSPAMDGRPLLSSNAALDSNGARSGQPPSVAFNEPAAVRPGRHVRRVYRTWMSSVTIPHRPYLRALVEPQPVEPYRRTNCPAAENGPTPNLTLTVHTLGRFNLKFVLPVHEIKRRFHSHKRGRLPVRRTKPRPNTVNAGVTWGS